MLSKHCLSSQRVDVVVYLPRFLRVKKMKLSFDAGMLQSIGLNWKPFAINRCFLTLCLPACLSGFWVRVDLSDK